MYVNKSDLENKKGADIWSCKKKGKEFSTPAESDCDRRTNASHEIVRAVTGSAAAAVAAVAATIDRCILICVSNSIWYAHSIVSISTLVRELFVFLLFKFCTERAT